MAVKVVFDKEYFAHFVLLFNGRRMFKCLFSEIDRNNAYFWMEGYLKAIPIDNIQFDDYNPETDTELIDMVIW